MKKALMCALMGILVFATASRGDDKEKDEDRLANCGTVMKEILDVPDDIPRIYWIRPTVLWSFRQC